MKIHHAFFLLLCLTASSLLAAEAATPNSPVTKKGPASKIYLAETKGETQIQNGEKIFVARQAMTFDASGTVIETKVGASNTLVFSNGSSLLVDENSHLKINRFTQDPFKAAQDKSLASTYEPSVSHSEITLSSGSVSICVGQMISGSTMTYSTPLGTVNIRSGKVAIRSTPEATTIDLLDGDITVRAGEKDVGGQVLRAGERAIITRGTAGGNEFELAIQPIPPRELSSADRLVEIACTARRAVTFDIIQRKAEEGQRSGDEASAAGDGPGAAGDNEAAGADAGAGQEIVAQPTVPANPPNNIVISPDRLPGT